MNSSVANNYITDGGKQLTAVAVTERQASVIFIALDHCRTLIASEPGDEKTEYELTEAMRLFTWRD